MILKEYDLSVRLPQERAIDTGIILVQSDKDVYKLNARVFDGVNEINYADVTSATITFGKADKNVVQGDMIVEANKLSYILGTNEIACPGKLLVSIQLWGTTERLSTARLVMQVEKDLITENAVQSTSEFPIIQQLKKDLEAIDVVDLTNQFNSHKAEKATQAELGHVKIGVGTSIDANGALTSGGFKILNVARDISLEGDQVITTVGFKPRFILFLSTIPGVAGMMSIGVSDGSAKFSISDIHGHTANSYSLSAAEIDFNSANGRAQGKVTAISDTGFTITWTKTGTITGTANIAVTCFR